MSDALVEELRGEVFLTDVWKVSPAFTPPSTPFHSTAVLAEAASTTLGAVVRIEEEPTFAQPVPMFRAAAAEMAAAAIHESEKRTIELMRPDGHAA